MNVPKLRFGEFNDEWDISIFTDIVKKQSAKYNSENEESDLPCIELEHIAQGTGSILGSVNAKSQKSIKNRFAKGNVLFGKLRPYLKKYAKPDFDGVCSSEIWVFSGKTVINDFLYSLIQTDFFMGAVSSTSGSKMPRAEWSLLGNLAFGYPKDVEEQQKIADFLSAVNDKITALTAQKTALTQYKQGMMQRIFSQTLRFKDDNGADYPDWEAETFDAIAKRTSQKFNPEVEINDFPCIELEHLEQGTGVVLGVVSAKGQKSIKTRFEKGNVLFGKLRPYLRKYTLAKFNGVCSSEIWVFVGVKVCNEYLYYLIQSDDFMNAVDSTSGSKMPRAEWDMLKNMEFSYPASKKEQIKIAQFLTELDDKINSVDVQIQSAQQWKQGLLQQMFV